MVYRIKRINDVIDKANEQITRIERIIDDLLADIDIGEMTAYERLTLVHRFFAQHQRATKIQQQTAMMTEDQEDGHEVIIVALMSLMRGEKIQRDQIIDMEDAADGKNY